MKFSIFTYHDCDGDLQKLTCIEDDLNKFYCDYSREDIDEFFKDFHKYQGTVIVSYLRMHSSVKHVVAAFDLREVKPLYTLYEIGRAYGGPEEGGWYYDLYTPYQELEELKVPEGFECRVGYVRWEAIAELYYGQYETRHTPYYC